MWSNGASQQSSHADRWYGRFAQRAARVDGSELQSLFATAFRPDIVPLASGMPDVSTLPMETVGAMMAELVTEHGTTALQYGSAQGEEGLRESICGVMAAEGIDAHPDDVVVTVGSQQALDLVARVFVDPGDSVVTEGPTYLTALGVFVVHEAHIVQVAVDGYGVVPEALEEAFTRLAAAGRPAKLFYTVPTFQNPAGVTLTTARRAQVLEVCRHAGVLVVEDNPYGLLHFDGEPVRALRADAPEDVIYLGSFSKTLAPGLRVGWALVPPAVRDRLALAAEVAMLSHSPLAQLAVDRFLRTQPWDQHLKAFRETYRRRRDAMLDALEEFMPPGVSWTKPGGGFFVWVTLPEKLDAVHMLPRALQSQVAYVPGAGFFTDGSGQRNLRLSFCTPPPHVVREGVRLLADVVTAEAEAGGGR
jgi:DNA-binding transcriptional MocR family regulator